MKSVFEASSGLEAHMILNLLEQAGISGRIEGEYLQGGLGELQAMNPVRVLVPEKDFAEARNIIDNWDSIHPASDNINIETQAQYGMLYFVMGVVAGAAFMYWKLKGTD